LLLEVAAHMGVKTRLS